MKEVSVSLQSHRLSSHGVCQRHSGVERLGVTIRCHPGRLETSGSGSLEPHVLSGGTQTAHAHVGPGATLLCVCVGKGPGATFQQYGVPGESPPCILPITYIKGVCKQMSWRR